VQELDIALQRAGLSAAFLFTIPGPKMIWQFGELGYDYSINYDCRTCPKPVRWDYFEDHRRKYLYDVYSALANLKTSYDVFKTTDYELDVYGPQKTVTLHGEAMDALIVGNFDVHAAELVAEFPQTGYWYDYITGDSLNVESTEQAISLQPGEYRVYTSERITASGLNVSVPEQQHKDVITAIYPNPSDDIFNITLNPDREATISVKVFDLYGRHLATLFEGKKPAGTMSLTWNPQGHHPKGAYLIKVNDGHNISTKKILLR
jgi:hypothetical protein